MNDVELVRKMREEMGLSRPQTERLLKAWSAGYIEKMENGRRALSYNYFNALKKVYDKRK